MDKQGFASALVLLIIVVVALMAGGILYYEVHQSQPGQAQANTRRSGSTPTSTLHLESSSVTKTSAEIPISSAVSGTKTSAVSVVSISGWPTYVDPLDGFSFRYPPDCELNTSTYRSPGENVIVLLSTTTVDACSIDLMAIKIYHKAANQPLLDYWRGATDLTVLSSTPMTVNGYSALDIEGLEPPVQSGEGEQDGTSDLLLTKDSTLIVDFDPSPFDALAQDGDPVPEAILTSFRF